MKNFEEEVVFLEVKELLENSVSDDNHLNIVAFAFNNPQQSTVRIDDACDFAIKISKRYLTKYKFDPQKVMILHQLIEYDRIEKWS